MAGFYTLKKDSNYDDLIKYVREKKFQAIFTDYNAHKLNFLSRGNPLFVEFHSNPFTGWKRLKKATLSNNWAVLVPDGKNLKIYEAYIKTKKIDCSRQNIQNYIVFSSCSGNQYDVSKFAFLGQFK